jgi:hypothetical protein
MPNLRTAGILAWLLHEGIVDVAMDLPNPAQELAGADCAEGSSDLGEDLDDGVDVTLIRWMLSLTPSNAWTCCSVPRWHRRTHR